MAIKMADQSISPEVWWLMTCFTINVGAINAINAISPSSCPPACPFMLLSLPPLCMYAHRVFCMLWMLVRATIMATQLLLNAADSLARANLLVGHYTGYISQHWYT